SDVLALCAMGLRAVGRPNNMSGGAHLADLLGTAGDGADVVMLGEYDPKPDGSWPGRDGALKTAAGLAEVVGTSVDWALPPDRAKDIRQWAQSGCTDRECVDGWEELGERLTAALAACRNKTGEADGAPADDKDQAGPLPIVTCGELLSAYPTLRPP